MPLLCNNTINVGLPGHDRAEMRVLFRLKLLSHQNNFALARGRVRKDHDIRDPFVIPILTHHILDDELLVSYARHEEACERHHRKRVIGHRS